MKITRSMRYAAEQFAIAIDQLPMYLDDYENPEEPILEIFEDVFSAEVLEAIKNMEV